MSLKPRGGLRIRRARASDVSRSVPSEVAAGNEPLWQLALRCHARPGPAALAVAIVPAVW
jgi:hypothetical protein